MSPIVYNCPLAITKDCTFQLGLVGVEDRNRMGLFGNWRRWAAAFGRFEMRLLLMEPQLRSGVLGEQAVVAVEDELSEVLAEVAVGGVGV